MQARSAMAVLPSEMPAFFRDSVEEMAFLITEPDQWRTSEQPALNEATGVNHTFKWYNVQYTWQMNPSNSATWVGVNRKGAVRDGHNFDGLQPEEQERGSPNAYDRAAFPNDYSAVRYNEVALEAHLATVLILHRAGYTDLIDASDQAMLRAAKWIKRAADDQAAKGYRYFTDNREAARPLINYFYRSAGLPESRTRDQLWGRAFGFAWTYWTHGRRSIR